MTTIPIEQPYIDEIQEWHQNRIADLRAADGWLTLAGLFWLEPGPNTFGGDPTNDILFPTDKAAPFLGTFYLSPEGVTVEINPHAEVWQGDERVSTLALTDDKGTPTVLRHGTLSWFIIRRGDQMGVRLRDSESDYLHNFQSIDTFPIDATWRVEATLEATDPPRVIPMPTILGTVSPMSSPGKLRFTLNGSECQLDAFSGHNGALSLVFGDASNNNETYGGGRFLSVDAVDGDGRTVIDFNRAYNPPCAFTPYATCPRPTPENKLPMRVLAGEKNYHA